MLNRICLVTASTTLIAAGILTLPGAHLMLGESNLSVRKVEHQQDRALTLSHQTNFKLPTGVDFRKPKTFFRFCPWNGWCRL